MSMRTSPPDRIGLASEPGPRVEDVSQVIDGGAANDSIEPPSDAPEDERLGIWSSLSRPAIYRFLQRISGSDHARRVFADEVVRCGADDRILDIGCGTAELIELIPPTASYLGIDSRARYIAHARRCYGDRARFLLGTIEELAVEDAGPRDIVLAGAVLHHLDDRTAHGLLEKARSVLVPGGRFVAGDPVILPDQHPVARTVARFDRGHHVRTVEQTRSLIGAHFPDASVTVRSDLQRFPYDHVIVDARR